MVNLVIKITKKHEDGHRYTKTLLKTKANVFLLNDGVAVRILDLKLGKKLEECLKGVEE